MSDANICPICGGAMEDKIIQIDFRYKERLVVIDGVPAEVCQKCGEQLISAATSKDIDVLLESRTKPVGKITVPVLSFRRI